MRTIIFITLYLGSQFIVHAQDTLYKPKGVVQIVKIIEVNERTVKYQSASDSLGVLFIINKDDVSKIRYENGVIDTFPGRVVHNLAPLYQIDPRTSDFGYNFISISIFELASGLLILGYERLLNTGRNSVKCSFATYLSNSHRKGFNAGLDYYLYPFGQGKLKYFVGPSVELRKYEYKDYNSKNSDWAILIQNGLLFQPAKNINCSINVGIGYLRTSERYNNRPYSYGRVGSDAAVNLGFKF
ncbi:MAG: hypothetical protein ABIR66_03925 [Saprospiraceae bacterium]